MNVFFMNSQSVTPRAHAAFEEREKPAHTDWTRFHDNAFDDAPRHPKYFSNTL
jgi:hypothetical protein